MAQASFLEQENDHTPVSSNRFEDPTAAQTSNGFVVPSGLLDNRDDTQTTTAGRNARVAWTAPQNRLVDDATRRLQLACPDKKVVRVLPWPVEMKNLRRVEDTVPQRTDVSIVPDASPASHQMAGHVDAIRMSAYREKSPSAVFNSFSEFARSMVQENPTEWEAVERAWNEKQVIGQTLRPVAMAGDENQPIRPAPPPGTRSNGQAQEGES
ncbi:hypothetical protein NW759_000401 [Fusarium solani]|nr:hypothetical protein NW759_000401 [Fusarium solani]